MWRLANMTVILTLLAPLYIPSFHLRVFLSPIHPTTIPGILSLFRPPHPLIDMT